MKPLSVSWQACMSLSHCHGGRWRLSSAPHTKHLVLDDTLVPSSLHERAGSKDLGARRLTSIGKATEAQVLIAREQMGYSLPLLHKGTFFNCLFIHLLPSTNFVDKVRQPGLPWRAEEGKHRATLGSVDELSPVGGKVGTKDNSLFEFVANTMQRRKTASDAKEKGHPFPWPERPNPRSGSLCPSSLVWSLGFVPLWLPYCRCDGSNSKRARTAMQTGLRAF